MVLLFNVFITNQSANGGLWDTQNVSYDRGNLNKPSRFEIVKYALSTTAKSYPWKRAIINVELDKDFSTEVKKEELEKFIREEFKNTELFFSHTRNKFQEDWIRTYDLINDNLIYYQGNHDHIFLNSSRDYFKNFIDHIRNDGDNKFKTVVVSHWCEIIRASKCGYIKPYWLGGEIEYNQLHPTEFNKNYIETSNFVSFESKAFDSYMVISKELYYDWFMNGNWDLVKINKEIFPSNRIEIPRTEGVGIIGIGALKNDIMKIPTPTQKIYAPFEEIFRHFDGHFHQKISNDICPAIDIPPGYFENEIKIRYGYGDYKEGWVNINPKNNHYYAFDKNGTDYKILLEDIPYAWKDKIIEIDSNPNISEEEMLQYRLKAILETIYNDERYNPHINDSLKEHILNQYLKKFPQFNIN
jgi:hypothetical protein